MIDMTKVRILAPKPPEGGFLICIKIKDLLILFIRC